MGKVKKLVKDEKLFLLIRNFLLTYLPVQRGASENTVIAYRTVLKQYLKFVSLKKNIPVSAVTIDCFSRELLTAYLSDLIVEKGFSRARKRFLPCHMEQSFGGIKILCGICVCLLSRMPRNCQRIIHD